MKNTTKLMWLNSIIIQTEDVDFADKIYKGLHALNIDVLIGEKSSPDLIAVPYFAAVVDRNHVGKKCWKEYLEYRILTNQKAPCVIVDNVDQIDEATNKKIYYTRDVDRTIQIIHDEKRRLNRFELFYTNPYIQRIKMEIAIFWDDFR